MNPDTINMQELFSVCLRQVSVKARRFWLIRKENHYKMCADYECRKVCEHMTNERHFQKMAMQARAERKAIK